MTDCCQTDNARLKTRLLKKRLQQTQQTPFGATGSSHTNQRFILWMEQFLTAFLSLMFPNKAISLHLLTIYPRVSYGSNYCGHQHQPSLNKQCAATWKAQKGALSSRAPEA